MISASNEQLQQKLECPLVKRGEFQKCNTLEERYAIEFCLNLKKMPQKRMECLRVLLEHLALIDHVFLSGIRDSRKAGSL